MGSNMVFDPDRKPQRACFSRSGWWQTLCGCDAANQGFGWTDEPEQVGCAECLKRIEQSEHVTRGPRDVMVKPRRKEMTNVMMNVYKPPAHPVRSKLERPSVFLAGSIEMGAAERWQDKVTEALSDLNIDVFNPRRDDWDSSWVQSKDNTQFREQVEWELKYLHDCTWVFMYFSPGTQSPITLLELGLVAPRGGLTVVCPDGFWRQGNVDLVCERYHVPLYRTLEDGVRYLRSWFDEGVTLL